MTGAVVGLVASYVALATLLLSLNLKSAWRWPVKAAAIGVTAAFFVVVFVALQALLGWPTEALPPARFELHAALIEEPDRQGPQPGRDLSLAVAAPCRRRHRGAAQGLCPALQPRPARGDRACPGRPSGRQADRWQEQAWRFRRACRTFGHGRAVRAHPAAPAAEDRLTELLRTRPCHSAPGPGRSCGATARCRAAGPAQTAAASGPGARPAAWSGRNASPRPPPRCRTG